MRAPFGRALSIALALSSLAAAGWAEVKTGVYTGNSTSGRAITGIGFRPEVVIIKGDDTTGTDDLTSAVLRSSTMPAGLAKPLKGDQDLLGNLITSFDPDGFTVGSDRRVNQNPTQYYWVAFQASPNLKLGSYTGNGGSQAITGMLFQPDYVILMEAGGGAGTSRAMQHSYHFANSFSFNNEASFTGVVTSLNPTGFTVGSSLHANETGRTYHYVAWNERPGEMRVGWYFGNGNDNRPISVGFRPEYAIAKSLGTSAEAVQRFASMGAADASVNFKNLVEPNLIQQFQANGFEVGSDSRVNSGSASYFFVAFGNGPKPGLTTTEAAGTLTVTVPDYFDLKFSTAVGGGIEEFHDLASGPNSGIDLAGGTARLRALLFDSLSASGSFYNSTSNSSGPRLDILESTPTRVKVRSEALYQQEAGTLILRGLKGVGDYSVYPTGRLALRWERRTTASVSQLSAQMGLGLHRTSSAPLSGWVPRTQSGALPGPGGDDFVLGQIHDLSFGTYTDFLQILHRDWAAANSTKWFNSNPEEWGVIVWEDADPYVLPPLERWDSLLYFKPTDFANEIDPNVVARRNDYRGPDGIPVSVGWGWNENPIDTDFFNESEAAYTLDFDPANGLAFTMNGSSTRRFQPFAKIRQWRSLQDPTNVTLAGVPLVNDVHFHADVKPVARAQFTGSLFWHSTLESAADVNSPDVGSAATVEGGTAFVAGKYGQGARFNVPADRITFPSSGNLRVDRGAVELWYQPAYVHTDGVSHRIWSYFVDASNQFHLTKDAGNNLVFELLQGGSSTRVTVAPASYRWLDAEWVHLRATWDGSAAPGLQARLFVNRVEAPHADSGTYNAASMPGGGTVILGADAASTFSANGIFDEVRIYGAPSAATSIARGGLTASPSEYLASTTQNFTLALASVDALRRGAYVYFGADSRFRGLNVSLQTPGAGAVDLVWQYWNGARWADLESGIGFVDGTNHFTRHGSVVWSADPLNWSEVSIDGDVDLYYVRARLGSGTYSTFPVEREIRTDILLFQYCGDITTANQTFVFGLPPADAVSISSSTTQTFTVGATPPVVAAPITVTDAYGGSITPGNEIRIRIPAGFPLRWNTAITSATLGGSAALKVSSTLKPYEDFSQTVVLDVVTPFAAGDQLVVSGLEFLGFTNPAPPDNLELEIADDGTVAAFDDKTIQVNASATANISSFANQRFTVNQPPTPAETIFVTESMSAITITDTGNLRIHIPGGYPMEWDQGVTSVTLSGTAASLVATGVSYPTPRILLLDVTASFSPGQYVAVSGLRFKILSTPAPANRLGLDVNNDAVIDDNDDKTILVEGASDVPFFTATATDTNVKLEWLNPAFGSCENVHIRRKSGMYPTTPSDGDPILVRSCFGLPGNKEFFDDSSFGLTNDVTYYYAIFVEYSPGMFVPGPGKRVKSRPFDTSGPVKWAYSTAASSMAPPGIRFNGGSSYLYAVSNDKILHAMRGGNPGGDWPAGWKPFVLGAPAQARPPVLGFSVGASANGIVLLGSQDGSVYAINAQTGATEWIQSIASMVQAAPAGNFKNFDPGALDFVLVGTRNSSAANSLTALDLVTGAPQWSFTNSAAQNGNGLEIGIISSSAAVHYGTKRVFFASRTKSGGSTDTVWCVNFAANPPQRVWSKPLGNIDGSPILVGGVLYVGTNSGEVYALDPANGNVNWSLPLADGAVKNFVFPHFGTSNVFVSTSTKVWSIDTVSAVVNPSWPVTSADVPSPSTPTVVPFGTNVLLGGGNGKLYQLDTVSPLPTKSVTLGDGTAAVGTPALDLSKSMVYVGTDQGVIYGVLIPLP